jgi:hypothetical protein
MLALARVKLEDGEDRMEKAQILFTHAYNAYKKVYDDEKAASRPQEKSLPRPRPGSSASFLDDVCMFDADDDAPPTSTISELDLFFAAYRTHGRGDRDKPLLWWKVRLRFGFLFR